MKSRLSLILVITSPVLLTLIALIPAASAYAQTGPSQTLSVIFPEDPEANKFLSASLAFSIAALSAGWAIGRAGSAGLAATAERPEVRTTGIIISALGEALAIYGIVVAILILGQ